MDKELLFMIEKKLHNNPGFWEGLMEVSLKFTFESHSQIEAIWEGIANYLKGYEYIDLKLSQNGVSHIKIHPFASDEDLEAAKIIICNFLK
jgi:hypothetical protein